MALEPECSEEMYEFIRIEKRPYSILVDKSSDIMCEKECAIVRYYNETQDKVTVGFVDIPVCNDATAENIFNSIASSMHDKDLEWSNCVGFSSDNCNVMIGKNNSLLSRVKAPAAHIGCPSHLVNICAKTAAKELSMSPEELLIDIYYYFEKSSKRREDLKQFQEFCNVAQQRVQRHCPTRWLSLGEVPPSAEVTPSNRTIELGTEKTMTCDVHNFYPKDVSIRWAQYRKGSSECELLDIWTCAKSVLENSDGTFNVTSLLTLNPKIEDDGNTYSCLITHRSLQNELSRNFTLTVTEREDNRGAVIGAVLGTLLIAGFLGIFGFLYVRFMKKDPPTLSEITGNDKLIDMNRTTLTCQIMNFRPNAIELSVCIRRSGEEKRRTIYTWKSGGHPAPVTMSRDDGGGGDGRVDVEQGRPLMNGSAGHEDGPLQLEVEPRISKKRLGTFTCQCTLHITPSYELDNGAELSVHVTHPALTSPASVLRTLSVIGGETLFSPKLLSVMAPGRVIHDEQVTLTCPINAFKPRALTITWLKKDRNQQETELVTWTPAGSTTHNEKYSHNLKGDEHEDKSYSVLSALTMKATVTDDDGVTYICRTFHPATNLRDQREETMRVT
ncbi:PREDICTED: uncharacterized protein LOC108787494, partial [Nanorana parkeri]|uniref:uncharacterized protein LOC108787494 n=1 Tax=Nanorana parkeri TaxID=125878 RepID=UPI000854AFF4